MAAGAVLAGRAAAALRAVGGFAVYEAPPIRAAVPYALVEAGAESDWGHKSGAGREVRLTVTMHDRGEATARLRALAAAAEEALAGLGGTEGGWQVVSLRAVRGRLVPARPAGVDSLSAWTAEFRARMLAG